VSRTTDLNRGKPTGLVFIKVGLGFYANRAPGRGLLETGGDLVKKAFCGLLERAGETKVRSVHGQGGGT